MEQIFWLFLTSLVLFQLASTKPTQSPGFDDLNPRQNSSVDENGYFYAITLEGVNATKVWYPEQDKEDVGGAKLTVINALLGPEAKAGELNVVQVEAKGPRGPIKIPIDLLGPGKPVEIIIDISLPDPPVTFTLISGSGPVQIVGHNLLGTH